MRALGSPWQGIQLIATAAQIGVREGRRICGRYTVTVEDILAGRTHADAVCGVTAGIDVHAVNPQVSTAYDKENHLPARPYEIPLRALIARDKDNLMMAGRCISGDFLAHSSYRMTGNAVAMGEAAGITAALAAQTACLPHEVSWEQVAARLPQPMSV